MRVLALGAYRMTGTSKKSGAAYDMAKVVIQVPQEVTANQNMRLVGHGFNTKELDLEPEALAKFSAFPFPCELDLEVGSQVGMRGLQAVVTGAKQAK